VDTALLTVFQEIAHQGSFTAAARTLGYSQSAVSRQVSVLETELGARLFDRMPRGVRLTEAGRCLLPHAEVITGRAAAALGDLRALAGLAGGNLRVGAFPTAAAALVPRAAAAFRVAYPGVTVRLAEGLARDLVARLEAGDLDLAVITASLPGGDPAAVPAGRALDLRHVLDDAMFVAMHPGHRYARRDQVRLAELAGEDWIAGSDRPEETLIAAAWHAGFRPKVTYVITEWIAKQGLVAAGLGVTLMPSLAAGAARPDIALVPVPRDDCPARAIYAATLTGVTSPPALPAFLTFLDQAAAGLRQDTLAGARG
jgi:DNA-binding transcriptional LysR family regulator